MIFLAATLVLGFSAAVIILGQLDEIVDWLKRGIEKIREVLKMIVLGVKIFIKKIGEAFKEISKHYSQDTNGKWHETMVTREVSENEVPPEILRKGIRTQEVDVTDTLELKLA